MYSRNSTSIRRPANSLLLTSVIVLLTILQARAEENPIKVTAQGFECSSIALPAPSPATFKSLHRSPWPKIIGKGQPQGYSTYPEEIEFLDLLFRDMNRDGLGDLVYVAKETDAIVKLTIYLQESHHIFSKEGTTLRADFGKPLGAVAPFIEDLNRDLIPELILINESPPAALFPKQLEVTVVPAATELKYRLDQSTRIVSDALPTPIYIVRNKKTQDKGILLAESSLRTPSKKTLSKLFVQRSAGYRLKIAVLEKDRLMVVERAKADIPLDRPEELEQILHDVFPDWTTEPSRDLHHWEKRHKGQPVILFDWNGDGVEDRIVINKSKARHQIWDGKTNSEMTSFDLPRNTLLTGAYLDVDNNGSLEEIDTIYHHQGDQAAGFATTTLRIYHHFENASKETYSIPAFVTFPQSFADIDNDGDIDLVAIGGDQTTRRWIAKLISRWRDKAPLTLMVYKREGERFRNKPSHYRKIWISPRERSFPHLGKLLHEKLKP